jgi:hypothetical protein
MKWSPLPFALWLASITAFAMGPSHADDRTDQAVEATKQWLALVDGGKYAASWRQAAPFFQDKVPEKQWEATITAVRGPLGEAKSREVLGAQFITELPGAPAGQYVVIQFKTDFASKPGSIETVTPMKDAQGAWRVSGYYIK